MMSGASRWLCWAALVALLVVVENARGENVTYDGRALVIDGQRKLLFSGSIHYPRSTPQMWPSLISKAKEGGIDVIQTYVFWNQHEPQPGQYNFEGKLDLVKFIKEIQAQGLYATLRIGPFIEAEWNYGGLPFWLHDIPGIVYRSDNEPFKYYMQNFTTKIVNLMKSESLYASQGGPIILSQIENEYMNVEAAFHQRGPPYVLWAAKMAVDQQTGVPWVMCKQDDAPDPVINTCNGRECGRLFKGPNSPNKPALWTENWTSFIQYLGSDPDAHPIQRSVEDIAYNVALFIAGKKGSYVNYYMYHGGTNFGRTGAPYLVTKYYDQAPLDEYGLVNQPKWGHLKDLHSAVKLVSQTLLQGTITNITLGPTQEVYVFEGNSGDCAAFLVNTDPRHDAALSFRNATYQLPRASISILLNCKNEIYNTAKVSAQFSTKTTGSISQKLGAAGKWQTYREVTPNFADTTLKANKLLEHTNTTKDASDYLWYTFSFEYKPTSAQPVLNVQTMGHVVHSFINNIYVGNAHGDPSKKNFTLQQQVSLNDGTNNISLLSVMYGLPDSGAFLERRVDGLRVVQIQTLGQQPQDFGNYTWGYQVGLLGERLQIYTSEGSNKVMWSEDLSSAPLTWYKATFDAPSGDDPVVLNLGSMGKGEAWINGQSIGRYWPSFYTSKGTPSQTLYHIPRSFLKPSENLLVLLEELSGNPLSITIDTVSSNKICGHASDSHLPPVNSWEALIQRSGGKHRGHHSRRPSVQLNCPSGKTIKNILFASYGNPLGDCSTPAMGSCHSANSREVAERHCLGKSHCSVTLTRRYFGRDPCPAISKSLLVDAECG